jgi:uncharacterized protein
MTPQEQQLLQGLTDRINQTVLNEKDPDAEQFIQQSLGRNPDALYILAQTALVQQYALEQAKQQLDQAKLDLDHARQIAQQQPVKHSFLGSLLGTDEPTPPTQYAPVNNPGPPPPQYYGAPQYAQPGYAQPGYGTPGFSQGGGFLRSAMQTATGVAAGALAFEGIESLMHGFDHHAGYGMGGFDGGRPEEIVNNYYGDSAPGQHGDLSDRFANAGDQPSTDIEDRREEAFTSSTDNDFGNFADTNSYDSGSDDSGSSDFGGSDDGN